MINSTHNSDEELMQGLRESRKECYEEIFNRYWHRLYRIAFNGIKSREGAEEIVQDLFVTLWKNRKSLLISNLSHYLSASVRMRVISEIRSNIVHEKYWNYYKKFLPGSIRATDEAVEYNELNMALERAMQQLPEKSRIVFRLNRIQGLSISEISESLKMPRRTIEHHLTKSIRSLRVQLKDFILSFAILIYLI